MPEDLAVLFLPIQAIGKSNEHLRSPGTITLSAETALRVLDRDRREPCIARACAS